MLLDLMRRLRTVPARDLPTLPRCVLHVMADHWNAKQRASWPKVETIAAEAGCSESSARAAIAALVAAGWLRVVAKATPRDSARFEVRLDGAPIARVPDIGTLKRARVPGRGTQGAGSEHPECRDVALRVPEVTPEALNEAPREAPTKRQIAHDASARAGAGSQLAFVVVGAEDEGKAVGDGAPLPDKPAKRSRKAPGEPRRDELYAAAYVGGHEDAGGRLSPLTKGERALLGPIAVTHARYSNGKPIAGDELLRWFRVRAKAFRQHVEDPAHHRGGFTPFGFRSWLDQGHNGAVAWADPSEAAAVVPAVPKPAPRLPPGPRMPARERLKYHKMIPVRDATWLAVERKILDEIAAEECAAGGEAVANG